MEQQDEHEDYMAGADKAFAILHEAPAARNPRQQKELDQKRLLAHYPALYPGEPEEYRLLRAEAQRTCWAALSSRMQETLASTDRHMFEDLLAFARKSHRVPDAAAQLSRDGYHRLPTGLVLAGGVNSADHAQTFPSLVEHLRAQGLYVALLQPHSFGRVVGEALNEVLRQFSGLDTHAQHAEALIAWYQDEVGDLQQPTAPAPAGPTAAAALPSVASGPSASQGELQEQGQHQQQLQQQGEHSHGGGRQLRQRPAAPAGGGGGPRSAAAAARQEANRERPLVVVVEGTESVDPGCLRDVLLTLSESYARLPITVILGLTTAESALHEMLSSEVTDRCMACHSFKLANAMTLLNRLVGEVLLGGGGGWPGLAFEWGVASALLNKFFTHYYSTGILRQGLQLACIDHFRTQPASFLAAAALEGPSALRAACAKLPGAVAAEVRKCTGSRGGARLGDAVLEALDSWCRWAVALHWVAAAAKAAGVAGKWSEPYGLLWDGLDTQFSSSQAAKKLLAIERGLRQLPAEQVCQLAAELEAAARRVGGAENALEQELQQLRDIAAEAAQPPEQRRQQQQQQGEAGEGAAPQGQPEREGADGGAEAPVPPAAGGKAAGKPKQKRDVYYSKASRREALLQKATQAGAAAKSAAGAAAERKAQEAAAPGAKLAAWLLGLVNAALATPPTKLPGAAVFSCRGAGALECLSGAPRQAVHGALTQPHLFLEGLRGQVGCHAEMEDACLAYTLLDQDPNCVNVADWFHAFCDVHGKQEQQQHDRKGKKAAVKRKGKASAEGEEGGGGGLSEEARRQQQRELAARFSQATAELQLAGLVRPARKRRGDYVQRLVHMPAEAE